MTNDEAVVSSQRVGMTNDEHESTSTRLTCYEKASDMVGDQ